MKIIMEDGTIVEGEPLTEAEASIMEDLLSSEGVLYTKGYIASRDRKAVVAGLFAKYHITLRDQPIFNTEEVGTLVDEVA